VPKKHVYREGDLVRVVQPFVYQRCGYPYDIVKEGQRLGDTFAEDIVALIDKMDPREDPTPVRPPVKTARGMQLEALFVENSPFVPQGFAGMGSDYHDLCSRFARIIAQRRGFGGNERRIYTEDRVDLHGAVLRVSSKFVRKTGTRFGPSSYQSYEGEWDYDSGGLSNEQTHVILRCHRYNPKWIASLDDVIQIEAANVEPAPQTAEIDA
jgi:hypothetical protein